MQRVVPGPARNRVRAGASCRWPDYGHSSVGRGFELGEPRTKVGDAGRVG